MNDLPQVVTTGSLPVYIQNMKANYSEGNGSQIILNLCHEQKLEWALNNCPVLDTYLRAKSHPSNTTLLLPDTITTQFNQVLRALQAPSSSPSQNKFLKRKMKTYRCPKDI